MLIAELIDVIFQDRANVIRTRDCVREEREDRCLLCCKLQNCNGSRWWEGCIGGSSLLVRHSVVRDDHFRHASARSPFKRYSLPSARVIRFPASPDFPGLPHNPRFRSEQFHAREKLQPLSGNVSCAFVRFRFNESSVRVTMRSLKWMLLFDKTHSRLRFQM